MRAKEMLSKIRWHPDYDERKYQIVYLHRGAPKDEKRINFSEIEELLTSDFIITNKDETKSYIPYHRVLRIEDSEGNSIWKKRVA
ncbi:MAG: DUF504 domain-containing protein [Candidatus Methanofastidiosia archaeon]